MPKPRLSLGQIWNMNFGFFGIQFGWGLQLANMSAIYVFNNNPVNVVMLGGASMLIAAAFVARVKDVGSTQRTLLTESAPQPAVASR